MEINLKPWVWQTLALLLGLLLLFSALDKLYVVSQDFRPSVPKNTIAMSAEGKVSSTPDLATISLGVTSTASTAKLVQADMSKKINQVTDFVKSQGIPAQDIATSNFSVYPSYDYRNGTNVINGYQGSESITVKVHNVDKSTDVLNKILDQAAALGSNQIQGVAFTFDDPDNLRQEARKLAIDKAKQKAQEIAEATGLKLGRITNISEGSAGYPTPMPYGLGMGGGGDAKSSVPNVQTGSQDIVVNVTVTFELK